MVYFGEEINKETHQRFMKCMQMKSAPFYCLTTQDEGDGNCKTTHLKPVN